MKCFLDDGYIVRGAWETKISTVILDLFMLETQIVRILPTSGLGK